jgi:C-terminal processing protease CtpA/Prc
VQRFVPKLAIPCPSFAVRSILGAAIRPLQRLIPFLLLACAAERGSVGAIFAQSQNDGRMTVRDAPPGYPAAEAGIVRGDEILLIDGRDVRSLSPESIHRLLEGVVGTTVRLTVLRRGQIERITIKRAPFAPSAAR